MHDRFMRVMQSLMPSMQSTKLQVTRNAAVLQLCNAGDIIAAGMSNGVVCLVRWGDMGLQQVGQWKGHSAAIRGKCSERFAASFDCDDIPNTPCFTQV